MEYKSLNPNLGVDDVAKAVEFYTNVLDFALVNKVEQEGKMVWAMVQGGGVTLMFEHLDSVKSWTKDPNANSANVSFSLYINITGVEEFWKRLKEQTNVVQQLFTTFYGAREFTIRDPFGYLLTFAEDVTASN